MFWKGYKHQKLSIDLQKGNLKITIYSIQIRLMVPEILSFAIGTIWDCRRSSGVQRVQKKLQSLAEDDEDVIGYKYVGQKVYLLS